tara:strand:+ start:358 stop:609 length:252 start_codon:yes stop_codon:yes gene_type:complete
MEWSGRTRKLINRQVTKKQLSSFWHALEEDGVWLKPTKTGYTFYAGQYKISVKAISEAWYVSENAVRRLAIWLLEGNGDFEWE